MLGEVSDLNGPLYLEPDVHPDARGTFHEWFRASEFEELTGYPFDLQQANMSFSVRGTLRGLHFSEVPPAQAKFVVCAEGAVYDVLVDIREGEKTFGAWAGYELSAQNRAGLYVPPGFAHGFVALEDSTVCYLTTSEWQPGREHGIDPFDGELDISWPTLDYLLSDKDREAPTLKQAAEEGWLPSAEEVRNYLTGLRDSWAMANEEAGL